MTKYVVPVPNPGAGLDWQTTVPGIYTWDVVGITAELVTGFGAPFMYAATYDATTGTCQFFVNGVPFGASITNGPSALAAGTVKLTLQGSLAGFSTYDEPAIFPTALSGTDIAAIYAAASSYPTYEATVLGLNPYAYYQLDPYPSAGNVMADITGNGHDLTYAQATPDPNHVQVPGLVPGNQAISINGDYVALHAPATGIPTGSFTVVGWVNPTPVTNGGLFLCGFEDTINNLTVVLVAINQPGQPLFELRRTVNFVGPVFDTFLSDVATFGTTSTGRTPSLVVTNGTDIVLDIPAGFQAVSTPGPYQYSWQPGLNADTQSSDGTLTTVAIPALIIPAGYTVGTITDDLQPTDEWANVALWWDDSYQQLLANLNPFAYGDGAHLIYHQIGT